MKVYCPKCKTKREIMNAEDEFTSKRYRMIKGQCLICGIRIYRILIRKDKALGKIKIW